MRKDAPPKDLAWEKKKEEKNRKKGIPIPVIKIDPVRALPTPTKPFPPNSDVRCVPPRALWSRLVKIVGAHNQNLLGIIIIIVNAWYAHRRTSKIGSSPSRTTPTSSAASSPDASPKKNRVWRLWSSAHSRKSTLRRPSLTPPLGGALRRSVPTLPLPHPRACEGCLRQARSLVALVGRKS